ncbi:MAG: hypothetical protein PGN11_05115 [Quadrisphaera sp.]
MSLMMRRRVGRRVEVHPEGRALQPDGQLGDLGGGAAAGVEGVDAALVADAVELAVLHAVVDADQLRVALQPRDLGGGPGLDALADLQLHQRRALRGQPDHALAAPVALALALVGLGGAHADGGQDERSAAAAVAVRVSRIRVSSSERPLRLPEGVHPVLRRPDRPRSP